MTIASISSVRRAGFGAWRVPEWPTLLALTLVPALFGWFAFALVDSIPNFAPQTIRLSAEGEYDPYLDDFVVFYTAGDVAAGDASAELYSPAAMHAAEARELSVPKESTIPLPFYNPPALALPLAVLALLPIGVAAVIWTALQLGVLLTALSALWFKERARSSVVLCFGVLLAIGSSMPFHETVLHGQLSPVLLAGYVLLWFGAFERRNDSLVAVAVSLLLIKPQLALLPVVYLIATRRWRALLFSAGLQAAFFALASAVLGPTSYLKWLTLLIHAATWEDKNGIWVHAMFGWNAFVRDLIGPHYHALRAGLAATLSVATLLLALRRFRRLPPFGRNPELLGLVTFGAILVSPHLFAQDLLLTAVPLFLLSLRRSGQERLLWLIFGSVGWAVTFAHFDILMGGPEDIRVNFVTLWLLTGFFLCMWLATKKWETTQRVTPVATTRAGSRRPHPVLQAGLAIGVTVVLLASVSGLVGQRMAHAITYSYSSKTGTTYRILIVGLASE